MAYFETRDLTVGYNGKPLIHDINLNIEKGTITSLIGPNGAGKSTILKTITRHLEKICGTVFLDGNTIFAQTSRRLAKKLAVVLTDRVRPELMTCAEVVSMGRYPYTNLVGKLTPQDREIVADALKRVGAEDLAQRDFLTLSDGQRQRILLARALCQEPEVIVLDEPTAYLDIRYKMELLDILRQMSREKGITVILSLHEIDFALKLSDNLICVKGDTIYSFGSPEEILKSHSIEELYDMETGSYNRLFGSVELKKPVGKPQVFVIGGNGFGARVYRRLQRAQIPFATGILFENDIDAQIAQALSDHVITAPAFEPMTRDQVDAAARILVQCERVIHSGTPSGSLNEANESLLRIARERGIPIVREEDTVWNR